MISRKISVLVLLTLSFLENVYACAFDDIAPNEITVWRAYYHNDLERAQESLGTMLEKLYRIQNVKDVLPLYAKAVMAFGQAPQDTPKEVYDETVLPLLTAAFEEMRKTSPYTFEAHLLAAAELKWWVARRNPEECSPDKIALMMAQVYALLYGGTPKNYERATLWRAYAANVRDQFQDTLKEVREEDWSKLQEMLTWSYEDLEKSLQRLRQ
ncbi:MAG: hypothetical protein LCH26_01340 [Proteobacteria bacterium]|nr:hypothetical protein [Pseudomonadota bacterium]